MIDMQSLFFFLLYTALLWQNFRYTELLYHFMVEEGFNRSSDTIEKCIDFLSNYINQNQSSAVKYVKLTVASITVMILKLMPSSVQPYLNMMFSGVENYQKKAMAER